MDQPRNALAAPSHPQPYAWYARLRRDEPLFFDDELQLWVASGGTIVREAFASPALHVRPGAEPVPRPLLGRPAGEVFARLVRMNDGAFHARHRPEVAASASRWDPARVADATEAAVRSLAGRVGHGALLSAVPVQAMARLLGVAERDLDRTVRQVHAFTQGIAAGASAEVLDQADAAAVALMAQGEREGLSAVQSANRIALMQQSLDATAGLIGNAIVASQRDPASLASADFIERVAREDPAIHNTRRFAASELVLAGRTIAAGQCVLLVLVDEADPLGFGQGRHACPGERIALSIAATALRTLAALGVLSAFGTPRAYRPLPNARIPLFA